ncbi:flavin reductase family protein [Brucella anthropi]|uniref:Flavin reductase family protein n=1 Tax=Brucella anthropi TaxID=529 RepID=A0A6I0DH08_BRUAN|nr:flavin reductase family protein [Brucella anthropi]KAB2790324.1 flavin reductase family protein [Brucella anthropi]
MTLQTIVQDKDAFDPTDKTRFRKVAGHLAAGVAVITSIDGNGGKLGLTLTSVTSLSLDPPLFLACLADSSETLGGVLASGGFCINYLSSDQRAISDVFATKSPNKFAKVDHAIRPSGQIEITGALAVIECSLEQRIKAGDHSIILGRPLAMRGGDGDPLIHFRGGYREIGGPLTASP